MEIKKNQFHTFLIFKFGMALTNGIELPFPNDANSNTV